MERKQESKKERFFVRFFLFSSYFYSSFYSILFVFETWKGLREACRYSPLSTQNHHWKFISFFLVCLIFECCWPVFVLCLVVMVTVSVIVIVIASYLSASSHYSLSLLQKAARKLSTSTHCTCTLSQGPMLTRQLYVPNWDIIEDDFTIEEPSRSLQSAWTHQRHSSRKLS